MHRSFLDALVDPVSKESLRLEVRENDGDTILEGSLVSSSNTFPIVRGIPRFAGYNDRGSYATSFGWQWNRWSRVQFESENIGGPMENHTARMWERITSNSSKSLEGALIADFGCGPGRFIEVVRMKKGRVIGLDLSDAVEAAARNFRGDPDVLICQADVLQPPVKPGVCDGAFSIGVLHHTPDPRKGFCEMTAVIRSGGWVAACVYGRDGYYSRSNVNFYRSIFKALWPLFGHYPPLLYSYLTCYLLRPFTGIRPVGKVLRLIFPHVSLPDRRWALLDTFDSVTPNYQSSHESFEVFQWFKQAGLVEIEPSDWGFTAYHGHKST